MDEESKLNLIYATLQTSSNLPFNIDEDANSEKLFKNFRKTARKATPTTTMCG